MATETTKIETLRNPEYKGGFESAIESDSLPPGLSEDTVRFISAKKGEPDWMLQYRLKAYRHWLTMAEPNWPFLPYGDGPIDYQNIIYYSAPKTGGTYESLEDVPKEILETYDKLGIPLNERKALLGIQEQGHT